MKCQRGMVTREKERDSGYLDNICCIHGLKRIEGSQIAHRTNGEQNNRVVKTEKNKKKINRIIT